MDRLLGGIDHQILELLDGYPYGLATQEINWWFDRDMSRWVWRLLHLGVLERTPAGKFRTLGYHDEE